MTTRHSNHGSERAPMDPMRKTALVAGVLYLITFVSIPTLALYGPVKTDPDYILSAGSRHRRARGRLPRGRSSPSPASAPPSRCSRSSSGSSEGFALGFVASRVFEAAIIAVGVVSLLSLVTLRQPGRHRSARRPRWSPSGASLVADLQLDVPARTEPHAGPERPAAGHR